jgi:hypothetical protein
MRDRFKSSPVWSSFVLALLCLCLSASTALADGGGGNGDYINGQVVVKLATASDLQSVATQHGLDPVPLSQFGSRPIFRLRITDGASVTQRVADLATDARVIYVEPNYVATAPEASRPSWSVGDSYSVGASAADYTSQWAVQKIHLAVAQNVTRGAGVKVAVLDTGVDATHPALAGHLINGYDFVDDDNDPSEVGSQQTGPYGHGTHVAGLVALVAPDAKIMPLRVLDVNGAGNMWVLAEALSYAINNGATVINMSLATPRRSRLFSDLQDKVCGGLLPDNDDFGSYNDNVVIVAAAGNTGDNTNEYPSAESVGGVLSVAASTQVDTTATFSTRGSWVEVMSPGDQIVSSVPGGGYGTWRGTSMASPIAAGEAALVRAAFPWLRNDKIVNHIEDTATRIRREAVEFRIDAGAALTTEPKVSSGEIIISEFRFRGPAGASDEFIELYNNTDRKITVNDDDSQGWAVAAASANGSSYAIRFIVPNGTVFQPRSHYLGVNSAYSLGDYTASDATYTGDIEDNAGVAIFATSDTSNQVKFEKELLDAVGFNTMKGTAANVYRESGGLAPIGTIVGASEQFSMVRKTDANGLPQDTDSNANDFILVSNTGGALGGNVASVLGAPAPEGVTSPAFSSSVVPSLVDPVSCTACAPNRARVGSGNSGTLSFRRHFINHTGQSISRLRFRVFDITTLGTPDTMPPQAQLRLTSSSDAQVNTGFGTQLTVQGTQLELPSSQANGGGLNSSFTVELPGTGLAAGAGIDVQFMTNVIVNGRFRFFVNVEATTSTQAAAIRRQGLSKKGDRVQR